MATEARGMPTYPVWVGNLKENVKENDLLRVFSGFGKIVNCKVMKDEYGVSKHFGYVNFVSEADAERAARSRANFSIRGSQIKTKGPGALREENHLTSPTSPMVDYRPYTDCSFGESCKKGRKCPYRHNPEAQSNQVCLLWLARNCTNIHCAYRHPGSKEESKESSPAAVYASLGDLIKCGGRCGTPSCPAHFESEDDLAVHIRMSRKFKCRACRAIFLSEPDYLSHKRACPARLISDSTDHSSPRSSESADVEQLSDSTESNDEEAPVNYLSQPDAYRPSSVQNTSTLSPSKQSSMSHAASETVLNKPKRRRCRGGRGRKKSAKNTSATNAESTDPSLFSLSAAGGLSDESYDLSEYSLNVEYDSESDSDDLDWNEDLQSTELNRLMSFNEIDMYDSEEESGAGEGVTGAGSEAAKKETSPISNKAHPRALLEPVGVFWDIENCPVPMNKSAFSLAGKIRREFFQGKREAEFMCVCDITKERKDVIDALNKAHVTLVHVSAVAKNAADDKLRQSLRRFAHTYPSPSTVVLISGDVNFSPELNDLRYIHNITIVLLHSRQASDALKEFANTLIDFDTFVGDVDMQTAKQKPILSRIVIVSNLPKSGQVSRVKNRLGMLSDNCGGKVLNIDLKAGTARILYRTNEWAVKSMKRMAGEDVYGHKIATKLEPPTPFDAKMQLMEQQNLSGPALGKSYPPRAPPRPLPPQVPGFYSPNPPPRRMDHTSFRGPTPQIGPPIRVPMLPPPHLPPPRPAPFTQAQPHFSPRPGFPYGPPPLNSPPWPNVPPPITPSQLPPGPIPRPEGKILIFKIPPIPPSEWSKLDSDFVAMRLAASVKGSHFILWHSYSELQILLTVDFIQTALARKEEIIRSLYEKGDLRPELAQKFLSSCVDMLTERAHYQTPPWDVTLCGWTPDEQEERITRSKVISLLRQYVPAYWTKWANFKKRYLETYATAISEMAVHNACRGAVQIVGDASNTQSQVIVFYEFSPVLKLGSNPQHHAKLKKQFEVFLHTRPEKRVKLLDFVREFVAAGNPPLPAFSSGKILQELICNIPNVSLVGNRPSAIFVSVLAPGTNAQLPPAQAPNNLSGISAAFKNLLMQCPSHELPYSGFQQEYQRVYHKSFRVSDYLITEGASTRQLLEACDGITVKDVRRPDGKTEIIVALELPKSQQSPKALPPPMRPTTPVKPGASGRKNLSELTPLFVKLLKNSPGQELLLKTFQQEFQTFYHRSGFRVSDYLPGDKSTRDLLTACEGIKLWDVQMPTGKKETVVRLAVEPQQRSSFSGSLPTGSAPLPTATTIVRNASVSSLSSVEQIPRDGIELFRKDCIEVLSSLPEKKTLITKFPEGYSKVKNQPFSLAKYKAKKILHLVQAIPDVVKVTGDKDIKCIELILPKDKIGLCEKRIEQLLYGLPDHGITLDRFMMTYERLYDEKLTFFGHGKLIKLLENLPNSTLQFSGIDPKRRVSLKSLTVFAYEITDLLSVSPSKSLPINGVVPAYKTKFGRDLMVNKLGVPRLIKALEAITDVIEIRGEGASRTIHLLSGPKSKPATPLTVPDLPPPHLLVDEITALMVNHFTIKMTVNNLTKKYNETFRLPNSLAPVDSTQLAEALKQLDNFKVSTTLVELLPASNPPSRKASATNPPTSQPARVSSKTDLQDFTEMPALISVSPKKPSSEPKQAPVPPLKDAERLSSETKRMLLRHHEHAQTLSELVDCFQEARDPARPTAEMLCESLKNHNARSDGGEKFEISYIPSSIGDTIVQLNRKDCLFKLSLDLQYLFVYKPSSTHTMLLSELESVYAECYGHRLSCAVYGSPTVELLFDHKQVKSVVELNQATCLCSLTDSSRQLVLISLLSELVFQKGQKRVLSLSALPRVYQEYFGCSLDLGPFGVKKLSALFQLPKVKLTMSMDSTNSNLVLRLPNFVAEQIRHLLTLHDGRIPFNELEDMYTKTFGYQDEIDIKKTTKGYSPIVSSVSNFAGNHKWLVWSPSGRPYPFHKRGTGMPAPAIVDHSEREKSVESLQEWPSFDDVVPKGAPSEVPPTSFADANTLQVMDIQATFITPPTTDEPPPLLIRDTHQLNTEAASPHTAAVETSASSAAEAIDTTSSTGVVGDAYSTLVDLTTNSEAPSAESAAQDMPISDTLPASFDELTSLLETSKMADKLPPPLLPEVSVDPSPYGFLEKELGPELMAELISNTHSLEEEATTSDAEPDLFDYLDDDLPPPPDPALDETLEKLILVSEAMARREPIPTFGKEEEEKVERKIVEEPMEPVDYLESGMNPEEVLKEFKKAKEQSGGVLTPLQMDPFLTYFGELSGQAIERMEAEEQRKKPKKTGPAKKKPTMAIRFPGQPSLSPDSSQPAASSSASDAPINGGNERDSPLSSSSSGPLLSQEDPAPVQPEPVKPSCDKGVVSGHMTDLAASDLQSAVPTTETEPTLSSESQSGTFKFSMENAVKSGASAKIASIREKSVADWRPFVLATVDYTLSREGCTERKDSIPEALDVD